MTNISPRTITSMQNVNILRNASAAPATRAQLLLPKVASITTRLQSRRARWPIQAYCENGFASAAPATQTRLLLSKAASMATRLQSGLGPKNPLAGDNITSNMTIRNIPKMALPQPHQRPRPGYKVAYIAIRIQSTAGPTRNIGTTV